MTEPKDPPRLLDAASGAPGGLREVLSTAERDVGTAEQVARLAARLAPLMLIPGAAPTGAPTGMSAAAKVGVSALALLVAGGGAWLLSTSRSASPSAPTSPPAASPAHETSKPTPAPSPAPVVAPSEVLPESGASAPAASPAVPDKPSPPAQLSEAELLEQARGALRGDPARALARANEHRRRFPGGVLVQEREVIAIQALRHLGRDAEADQRSSAFQKAFPGSAFQRKLKTSP